MKRKLIALVVAAVCSGGAVAQSQQGLKPGGQGLKAPAAQPTPTTTPAAAAPAAAPRPAASSGSARVSLVDRVVAVVNNEVITESEISQRVQQITMQLQRQGGNLPSADVVRKQVLERVITERAMLQQAKESGVAVDDAQLDRALSRMAESNGMSLNQLRDRIEADGVPFTRFRQEFREEMLISRLREREVDRALVITEPEVDAYLAEQKSQAADQPEQFLVSQILLKVREGAPADEVDRVKYRAEQVMQRLNTGADFAKTAAQFSEAPQADQGGSLGWRPADRLPQLFVDALKAAKVGDHALVRSDAGFHVLKLADRRSADMATAQIVDTHQVRHILLQTSATENDASAKRRLDDFKQRVEKGSADFAELAKQYSADRGSAQKGGDLGWVYPGDTVPEFERTFVALQPGQLSDPVQSQFGWHLIQLVAKKREPMSQERVRGAARVALRERKLDQAYNEWVRSIRDRAYVEYKQDQ